MSDLLAVVIAGRPGPKGSLNAFCTRCARKKLPRAIAMKEESEVGTAFRAAIVKALKQCDCPRFEEVAVSTRATVYIERQHEVRAGVTLETYRPTSRTPFPIHHGSGDIEKHVRVLHDALQDVGVLADDCIVVDLDFHKRWATPEHPAGIEMMISRALDD